MAQFFAPQGPLAYPLATIQWTPAVAAGRRSHPGRRRAPVREEAAKCRLVGGRIEYGGLARLVMDHGLAT
jgi:hypothetical protein